MKQHSPGYKHTSLGWVWINERKICKDWLDYGNKSKPGENKESENIIENLQRLFLE